MTSFTDIFSYWIVIWFIFFILFHRNIYIPNPKFMIILGIVTNFATLFEDLCQGLCQGLCQVFSPKIQPSWKCAKVCAKVCARDRYSRSS